MSSHAREIASSPLAESDPQCLKSLFLVSNVHCSSCVSYITEVLSVIPGVRNIDISILTHKVRVLHSTETSPIDLAKALMQVAFEVHHVTTYDYKDAVISDLDTTSLLPRDSVLFAALQSRALTSTSPNAQHIANCDACREEEYGKLSTASNPLKGTGCVVKSEYYSKHPGSAQSSDIKRPVPRASFQSTPSAIVDDEAEFNARLSIEGMSCASCVKAITNEVKQLEFVKDVTVNLLTNSATIVYTGPQKNIEKVVDNIEDIGFGAFIDDVNKIETAEPSVYAAEIAIGGMTCGSCVATVTQGLEELSFVTEVSVNLLSHSGIVKFVGQGNIDAILEKIDDLGYDASVSSVQSLAASSDEDETKNRIVSIRVNGMFCRHCPDKIFDALRVLPDLELEETLSVQIPILKVTYTPHPPSLTIRSILRAIEEAHDGFQATVYHPPSIEDRSRTMQLHERRRLLERFIFVLIVAIPTFVIGIVFMSLVSSDNSVRRYLEQPMWAGNVSRLEWALFIMTTPVMLYGTDIFHVRAMKEIYSLWRPGSRVPIWRRFYQFGSMNLLISAGTMVAYVSSLAVLIMDAVVDGVSSTHSSTYFDSVVFLTVFILAGRFMEAYSKARTGDAVASLGKLRPSEALLIDYSLTTGESVPSDSATNEVQRINIDLLEIGDVVSIPHGASPPADGVVVSPSSYQFDESSLTGESKPVKKSLGDQVYTGSVNLGRPVEIKVTALGGSSMLDQIINVVREGQSRRAPLERVADSLVSHFVPFITLIAILTFVIWLSLGLSGVLPEDYLDIARGGWAFWSLEFAIAVFVVACPCGLALAAPTALFVGGGLAARHGILVKGGGEAFQEASRLTAIVFDKTGTLTEGGSLKVSDYEILVTDRVQVQVAWALARKLEESSNHPMARAISEFCSNKATVPVLASDIEEKSGHGMKGTFTMSIENLGDQTHTPVQYEAAIGNESLLKSVSLPNIDMSYISDLLSKYQASGKSTAILSLRKVEPGSAEKSYFAPAIVFATTDPIRPDAAQVVSKLQKRHVDVFMCTGDNQTTAYAVADMVGIPRSNVMANIMPAGKAEFVRKLQERLYPVGSEDQAESQVNKNGSRSIVAFVGDGVNDSPALAAADVSIAMASGSDVAMNSASFILLNSELDTILQLVVLSRRVFNRVRMNFGWAVVYNLCLVPIAAGVLYPIVTGHTQETIGDEIITVNTHWRLSPVWAALAMALSSISVICSSLALGIDKQSIKKIFGLHK